MVKAITLFTGLSGLFSGLAFAQLDSDMGPAAFLWPTNRAYSAANDNTAPCGSAAGFTNRTNFPMNPTTNDDFTTIVSSFNFPDSDAGHECYAVPNAPSSVTSGSNATLQLSYISQFETEMNKTFYVCADIIYVPLTQFTTDIPCFNVSIDDPTAVTSSAIAGATATSMDGASQSGSSRANTSSSDGDSLSGGAIAGIVVGSVVGAALVASILFFLWRHHHQKALRKRVIAVKMNELTNPARAENGDQNLLDG